MLDTKDEILAIAENCQNCIVATEASAYHCCLSLHSLGDSRRVQACQAIYPMSNSYVMSNMGAVDRTENPPYDTRACHFAHDNCVGHDIAPTGHRIVLK